MVLDFDLLCILTVHSLQARPFKRDSLNQCFSTLGILKSITSIPRIPQQERLAEEFGELKFTHLPRLIYTCLEVTSEKSILIGVCDKKKSIRQWESKYGKLHQ